MAKNANFTSPSNDLDVVWIYVVENEVNAYFTIVILVLLIPTIVVYTTLKELKENIRLQLFIFYLAYTFQNKFFALVRFYRVYTRYFNPAAIEDLSQMAGLSVILWLNVISCELLRNTLSQRKIERDIKKDRRRLRFYIIYTGVMVILVVLLQAIFKGTKWHPLSKAGVIFAFLLMNLVTFLVISVHICRTRFKLATASNRKNGMKEVILIIIRLFAMMGISRIIVFGIIFVWRINGIIIMQIIELLMKANIRKLIIARLQCCYPAMNSETTDV
ncbi:uncharacterized protein LOC142236205 [Haematobia irritans]|uniref:uncharacterized protein LOC142236205 n=1 Tax=Haematobia irritans TaxID=7368 RepID=UPI003F4F5B7F